MAKIMVVDDEGDTLVLVKAVLEGTFEVTCFESSVVALKELRDGKILPDLILLDMRMPELSGPEFCKELRKDSRFNGVNVVFFTASSEFDKSLARSSGAMGFIFKPFDNDKIIKDINDFLKTPLDV